VLSSILSWVLFYVELFQSCTTELRTTQLWTTELTTTQLSEIFYVRWCGVYWLSTFADSVFADFRHSLIWHSLIRRSQIWHSLIRHLNFVFQLSLYFFWAYEVIMRPTGLPFQIFSGRQLLSTLSSDFPLRLVKTLWPIRIWFSHFPCFLFVECVAHLGLLWWRGETLVGKQEDD
jgi:hypothetical protein